jgi:hypothetical protein
MREFLIYKYVFKKKIKMSFENKFISSLMKDNCKFIDSQNIKKIYNNEFEILVYKLGKKKHVLITDKRNNQTIVYNNIQIASFHITL